MSWYDVLSCNCSTADSRRASAGVLQRTQIQKRSEGAPAAAGPAPWASSPRVWLLHHASKEPRPPVAFRLRWQPR
eukprot:5468524-Alexandrium_andersonii.AAC.1